MKNIGIFIFSYLAGAAIIVGYSLFQNQNIQKKIIIQKLAPASFFSVKTAPSESLKGSITAHTGSLLWESRIATQPSELKDNVQIQQGERLVTEDNSYAIVNFDKVCSISLEENSDLSFIQTLPVDLVVEQKKGKIEYTVNGNTPLSIRVRSALIAKTAGIIQITLKDDDPVVLISTIQGTAQIGFNDPDYVSQVFTLREGQVYEYNSDERTAINTNNK